MLNLLLSINSLLFIYVLLYPTFCQLPTCGGKIFCVTSSTELSNAINAVNQSGSKIILRNGSYIVDDLSFDDSGTNLFPNELFPWPGETAIITDQCSSANPMIKITSSYWKFHNGNGGKLIFQSCNFDSASSNELIHVDASLIEIKGVTFGPMEFVDQYANSNSLIYVEDTSSANIDGIIFDSIKFTSSSSVFSDRTILEASNLGGTGTGSELSNGMRIWIKNCRFEKIIFTGLKILDSQYVLIENNYFTSESGYSPTSVNSIYFRSEFFVLRAIKVQNNVFDGKNNAHKPMYFQIYLNIDLENLIVQNNMFYCSDENEEVFNFVTTGNTVLVKMKIVNNVFKGKCGVKNNNLIRNEESDGHDLIESFFVNNYITHPVQFVNNGELQFSSNKVNVTIPIHGGDSDISRPIPYFIPRIGVVGMNVSYAPLFDMEGTARTRNCVGPIERVIPCSNENFDPFFSCKKCLNSNRLDITTNCTTCINSTKWGSVKGRGNCTVHKCNNVLYTNPNVCGGNGNCSDVNQCDCDLYWNVDHEGSCKVFDLSLYVEHNIIYVIIPIVIICSCLFICFVIALLIVLIGVGIGVGRNISKKKSEKEFEMTQSFASKLNIDESLFKIKPNEIKLTEQLGSGSGGVVYKGKWKGMEVAVKVFTLVSSKFEVDSFNTSALEEELRLVIKLVHPNIARFFGFSHRLEKISIVMELCIGDLKAYFYEHSKEVSFEEKMRMIMEISSVMEFLHSQKIIHRDLKGDNVLLDKKLTIKLIDFGLSRTVENCTDSKTKGIGTPNYMAPEMIKGEKYDNKIDVYSFGILIFEIIEEEFKNPYGVENAKDMNIQFKIANDPTFRPKIDEIKAPNFIKTLAKMCWDVLPTNRPSFKQICEDLKKNFFEKPSLTIYFKEKEDEDVKAEDFELKKFTINDLRQLGGEKIGKDNKLYLKPNNEEKEMIEIVDNYQLYDLKEDSIVIIK